MAPSQSGEEGELSPTPDDNVEVNEEMSFIETVRSVHSFMGCSHIPDFDLSYGKDWACSNDPVKGKNPKPPGKNSVALPPDDWLCKKIEY